MELIHDSDWRHTIVRFSILCILAFGPALYSNTGFALEPREIFKAVDPSVVVVLASDAKGDKSNLGSGVIIAPLEIITSCKVVESAADIVVSQGSTLRKATLRFNDAERDLCQLHIDEPLPLGKTATFSASATTVEAGQDVYAVGAPRGMEHAISRAMVSSLREVPSSKARLFQIDVSLTGGSIGSGVFDQKGQLIGIATGKFKQADSATYAVPVDWLAELPQRSADLALNPVKAPRVPIDSTPAVAAKPAWWPRVGDRWKYRLSLGKQHIGGVNVEIIDVNGQLAQERITYDGSRGFVKERGVEVGFNPVRFQTPAPLPGGYQLMDLAPYADPDTQFSAGQKWRESLRVPAGQFNAWRIETTSEQMYAVGFNALVKCTYWYAPQVKRTVKMNLFMKASTDAYTNNETYELESFELAK